MPFLGSAVSRDDKSVQGWLSKNDSFLNSVPGVKFDHKNFWNKCHLAKLFHLWSAVRYEFRDILVFAQN